MSWLCFKFPIVYYCVDSLETEIKECKHSSTFITIIEYPQMRVKTVAWLAVLTFNFEGKRDHERFIQSSITRIGYITCSSCLSACPWNFRHPFLQQTGSWEGYSIVRVVVQFYPWFRFYFPLFWGMVMYDNKFETKENKI